MLKTKFRMPFMNKNMISREKVLGKLQHIPEYKLTLIVAPAGYGKTTAVLDFLRKCGLPVAWLSLDMCDNNPTAFWRYVCAALDSIAAGISKDAEYVFSSQDLMNAHMHINILLDRLAGIKEEFLLILDDLHLISDPVIMQGLSYLVDYMPAQMHLIFMSRAEPELKLAKHRIAGDILRLDEKDLRFGEEDIFSFYQARGYTLGNDDVKKVESYTEGWAAALVALAMSMEYESNSSDAIHALTRSSQDIGEYLKDEVISSWNSEKLSFAMKTSVLDILSEPLCNAVTGGRNARRMLREISEGNGFLMALDDQKLEYRYHHLFSNFLRGLLSDTAPEEIPALHIRAARWFEEHGFIPEAVGHLLTGGAYREAFEMIEHQTDYLIHQNDFRTLLSWIERLPKDMLDNSFQVALIYATYYAAAGRCDLSRQWLAKAKKWAAGERYAADPEWSKYITTECTLAEVNLLLREGAPECLPLLLSAAERNADGHFVMPKYFDINTGDIYYYRCPLSKAIDLYGENPDRYEEVMKRYRELISVKPGYHPLIAGEYLYENNKLEEALPRLLNALEEAKAAGCAGALVPAMVHLARIKRAKADMAGAFEVLDECERILQSIGKPHWRYLVESFRCRLNIEIKATEKTEAWFTSRKFNIYSEISGINEFELLVYSRALMAKSCRDDAGLLLKRLLAFTRGASRLHSEVEVLNLLALLAYRENDMQIAMDYLGKALVIGRSKGYFRSFMDESAPMAGLLRYYLAHRSAQPELYDGEGLTAYAKRLLLSIRGNPSRSPENRDEEAAHGIGRLLTPQEKKVLELLAKANTNAEIGAKLGISIRTVKTHTGNIYGKLGVKNRAQCMKLVREINLL